MSLLERQVGFVAALREAGFLVERASSETLFEAGKAAMLVVAPFALIAGVMVQVQGKYRPPNYIGWVITIVGFGLLTLLRADTSTGKWVGYQVVVAAGTGMIVSKILS